MPERDKLVCYLCGTERPIAELNPVATSTISHRVDLAISGDWFCNDGCFDRFRSSPHLQKRVYDRHDEVVKDVQLTISGTVETDLEEMEDLPKGLQIKANERARINNFREKLDKIEELQDEEDLDFLFRVYRNKAKAEFFNHEALTLSDWETLKENLKRLEDTPPEAREALRRAVRRFPDE